MLNLPTPMDESSRQPTMQQIADAAGVSRMAVSLALRNSPKISPKTSERIRMIAERYGYRPNPMVSALMTQLRHAKKVQRQSTIAYVTAFPTLDGWRRPGPLLSFYEGARRRAEALGFSLEEWWLRKPGMTETRFSEILFTRNILGLILAPLPSGGGGAIDLEWARFAMSTIGFSITGPAFHRASANQFDSIRLAIQELQKLGYSRIGLAIPAESDEQANHHWRAGMLVEQERIVPGNRVPPLLATGPFGRAFAEWFSQHRPDVVLSLGNQVLRLLEEFGLSVPEDVGFAQLALCHDDPSAGINQNAELVGSAAVDLVDAQLRRNERGIPEYPKTLLIPGRWVAGRTVRMLGKNH